MTKTFDSKIYFTPSYTSLSRQDWSGAGNDFEHAILCKTFKKGK